ncbi:MAG: DUF599 family protein [Hyphomonadaceae bacterium]|nr:DUF599 family protein [Hyphomonadaceae bacterium]
MIPLPDQIALALFALAWIFYAPALKLAAGGRGINADMVAIRTGWMRAMAGRENRFLDANLLGHLLNSASFFASTSMLMIAAVVGALFSGDAAWRSVSSLELMPHSTRFLFDLKLALVTVALTRGLLDFIWAIRQMNYCLAIVGAMPGPPAGAGPDAERAAAEADKYALAASEVLGPALSNFNSGVRGYYFALAAAAWLFGAWACMAATAGAVALLMVRQVMSPAAKGVRRIRDLVREQRPPA